MHHRVAALLIQILHVRHWFAVAICINVITVDIRYTHSLDSSSPGTYPCCSSTRSTPRSLCRTWHRSSRSKHQSINSLIKQLFHKPPSESNQYRSPLRFHCHTYESPRSSHFFNPSLNLSPFLYSSNPPPMRRTSRMPITTES